MQYEGLQQDKFQNRFDGFDKRWLIGDGSICNMYNLSGRAFPHLTTRQVRYKYAKLTKPNGLLVHDNTPIYVDGTDLYVGGTKVSGTSGLTDSKKELVVMGRRVLVFPDKKYYNFDPNRTEAAFGSLEATTGNIASLTFKNDYYAGEAAECNGIYNASIDFSSLFNVGDAVHISGCTIHADNSTVDGQSRYLIVREISEDGHTLRFYPFSLTLDVGATVDADGKIYIGGAKATPTQGTTYWFMDPAGDKFYSFSMPSLTTGDTLVWNGTTLKQGNTTISTTLLTGPGDADKEVGLTEYFDYTESGTLTVSRDVPALTHPFVHNNRLWGIDGNYIRCSALGDPKNFYKFDANISTGSWELEYMSEGAFTACCSYLGYPVFFKRREILKIMGYKPSNFETSVTTECIGVAEGKSLAVAAGTLFYYGVSGFQAYQGSFPATMHTPFDNARYSNVVAGSDGDNYYASAKDADNHWHLFVYDTAARGWYEEDGMSALAISRGTGIWLLDSDGNIWNTDKSGTAEADFNWSAEWGEMESQTLDKKRLDQLAIRLKLAQGATAKLEVRFNDGQSWMEVQTLSGDGVRTQEALFAPRRIDRFALRLSGKGEMVLAGITSRYAESMWSRSTGQKGML